MRRCLALIIAGLPVTGCASWPGATMQPEPNYYLAEVTRTGECFTRIVGDIAYDRICVDGDILRYSPMVDSEFITMPEYVQALFDTIPPGAIIDPNDNDDGTL